MEQNLKSVQTINDSSVPDIGQLVEVRKRQWIVSDIESSAFTTWTTFGPQNLIKLTSVDEDALGEELQVIWEIEPGARKLETAGLPRFTGFDDSEKIDAFLDAVRWGAITNADHNFLHAPFRSGITIEDYQLDPLVRAIEMPRVNLLIADDVGLGKTIEAGLVILELIVRHRARSVMVVCPADLQSKWQTEMQEKFGLEFKIVDSEYVKILRRERGIHVNPWTSFPRLITSMDWMKNGDPLRLLKDVLPTQTTYPRKFDLLIIDEAHNVAPSMTSSLESLRTKLIRTIAPHFEHRLFLTATPHNGYLESFTSLLELLDNQRFARSVEPDEKQLQKVLVRRLKTDLLDAEGNQIYKQRELLPLIINYTEEELKAHQKLNEFCKKRTENAKISNYQFGMEFIHKLLKKRLFSSPSAFAVSIKKYRDSILNPAKGKKNRNELDEKILRKAILNAEEIYAKDNSLENAINDSIEEVAKLPVEISYEETKILNDLIDWAENSKNSPDSKSKAIISLLNDHLKSGDDWNDNRIILFTEYRPTQQWLNQIFSSHGFGGARLAILNGDTPFDEREEIKAAFQAHPSLSPLRILLSTDAASEGVDLQNYCNLLIHVEIPWNPNVMEQRNGRIDRHGQKKTPYIWHPVGSGHSGKLQSDDEFLMKAVQKVNAIREDLGSVGSVIASQIEEAMLGKRKVLDTKYAENMAINARKYLSMEKRIRERIQRLHAKIIETQNDLHLTSNRVFSAVKTALKLAKLPPLKEVSNGIYQVPTLPGAWGRSLKGLEHPHTKQRRPISFDQNLIMDRDDIVLAHLNHKLVQMCLRLLRAEVWAHEDTKKLNRIAFRTIGSIIETPFVLVFSRLLITGGRHYRLHEELTLSGVEIKDHNLNRVSQVKKLEEIYDLSESYSPTNEEFNEIKEIISSQKKIVLNAIEARSKERFKILEGTLNRKKETDIKDLNEILDELEKIISAKLNEKEPTFFQPLLPGIINEQEELEEQKRQLKKDITSLKIRLGSIPLEREKEMKLIQERYGNLKDRTFPVAMIVVLPSKELLRGSDE